MPRNVAGGISEIAGGLASGILNLEKIKEFKEQNRIRREQLKLERQEGQRRQADTELKFIGDVMAQYSTLGDKDSIDAFTDAIQDRFLRAAANQGLGGGSLLRLGRGLNEAAKTGQKDLGAAQESLMEIFIKGPDNFSNEDVLKRLEGVDNAYGKLLQNTIGDVNKYYASARSRLFDDVKDKLGPERLQRIRDEKAAKTLFGSTPEVATAARGAGLQTVRATGTAKDVTKGPFTFEEKEGSSGDTNLQKGLARLLPVMDNLMTSFREASRKGSFTGTVKIGDKNVAIPEFLTQNPLTGYAKQKLSFAVPEFGTFMTNINSFGKILNKITEGGRPSDFDFKVVLERILPNLGVTEEVGIAKLEALRMNLEAQVAAGATDPKDMFNKINDALDEIAAPQSQEPKQVDFTQGMKF